MPAALYMYVRSRTLRLAGCHCQWGRAARLRADMLLLRRCRRSTGVMIACRRWGGVGWRRWRWEKDFKRFVFVVPVAATFRRLWGAGKGGGMRRWHLFAGRVSCPISSRVSVQCRQKSDETLPTAGLHKNAFHIDCRSRQPFSSLI